jgi:thiamine-phosphate pyrophosphorylase
MICAVSDARRRGVAALVADAVAARLDLVQLRERDLEAAALAAVVREALGIARGSRTRIVVNDRLDVALACGADGVHLRADSIAPAAARQIAPRPFVLGRSVHTPREAADAGDVVDYLVAGTVFPTASKAPDAPLLGVEGLRAIVAAARVPVLAIGGITLDRLDAIAGAGAAGVAGISLFDGCAPVREIARAIRARFDSANTAS